VPLRSLKLALLAHLRSGTVKFGAQVIYLEEHPCITSAANTTVSKHVKDQERARATLYSISACSFSNGGEGCPAHDAPIHLVHCHCADGSVARGFDAVVDASGFRPALLGTRLVHEWHSLYAGDAFAAIGDARGAQKGWIRSLFFGWRRYICGGDDALNEGLELGRLLGEAAASLRQGEGTALLLRRLSCTRFACNGRVFDGTRRIHQPSKLTCAYLASCLHGLFEWLLIITLLLLVVLLVIC